MSEGMNGTTITYDEQSITPEHFFSKFVSTRQPVKLAKPSAAPATHFSSIIKRIWTNQELRERSGEEVVRCEIRDDVVNEGRSPCISLHQL